MGIALAEVILELHGSFTLEWRLVIYVAETFVKVRITKRSANKTRFAAERLWFLGYRVESMLSDAVSTISQGISS